MSKIETERRKRITQIATKIARSSKYYSKLCREHGGDFGKILFDKPALRSNLRLRFLKHNVLRRYLAEVEDRLRAMEILDDFCRSEKRYLKEEVANMYLIVGK